MSTRTEDLPTRLNNAAIALAAYADGVSAPVQLIAEEICQIAQELEDLYVPADTTGEIPTNAQGVALARVIRGRWAGVEVGYNVTLGRDPFLPNGYVGFSFVDGYSGGIDREGRVST